MTGSKTPMNAEQEDQKSIEIDAIDPNMLTLVERAFYLNKKSDKRIHSDV
jgi:hypothetical protein